MEAESRTVVIRCVVEGVMGRCWSGGNLLSGSVEAEDESPCLQCPRIIGQRNGAQQTGKVL